MESINAHSTMTDVDHLRFFVLSVDTMCGTKIDQNVNRNNNNNNNGNGNSGGNFSWPDHPPLVNHGTKREKQKDKLEEMIRKGIPPALRCAVWTSSLIRSAHPEQDPKIADEYATLGKVRALEHGWSVTLKEVFGNDAASSSSSVEEAGLIIPDFGLGREKLQCLLDGKNGRDWECKPATTKGKLALARVLCSVQHQFNVEFCPMLPDIASILLSHMPESYAFLALREMVSDGMKFLPTTVWEYYMWCKTFVDIVKKMYPETYKFMVKVGAGSPEGLSPIFDRFFDDLFRKEHMARIMDIYMLEGNKLVFRIGLVLLGKVKSDLKESDIKNANEFWEEVRDYTYGPTFDFDKLIKSAYGNIAGRWRKSLRFPRRRVINRLIRLNADWAKKHAPHRDVYVPVQPLSLVGGGDVPAVLAKPPAVRQHLAEWLPPSLRGNKLDLIYSTNEHGSSLNKFYDMVSRTKRTFLLCEVVQTGAVIGMFATNAWHPTSKVYGDGGCFLFRVSPDPKCFKWKPKPGKTSFDEDIEEQALMERFMVSRKEFISMGGNLDGTCGLRLNEDLSRGLSAPAMGFDNEPLAGPSSDVEDFDVGLVEVYRFVREIDGKPLDHIDQIWNF